MATTTLIPEWTLTDRLSKARAITGMTQAEFAEALGISLKSVQRYEKGNYQPPKALVLGWAVTAGVSTSWLLTGIADTDPDLREYPRLFDLDLVA